MKLIFNLCAILFLFFGLDSFGQVGVDYDVKKPEKYENRKLGYEKTTETKFKVPRHFIQNTVTHYNYYFNANNKLNDIIARAKAINKDDFSKLLPFYSYSLDVTATSRRDLDSIIDKCTTAILIHDLRNDWVDNLYMLMGKAYYFRKEMDTAYITFQFVNHAFAPREEDGYPKPIASNANAEEGGNAFIVSTNEKRNIVKRTFSLPPSRNEALTWQVRTYIAKNQLTQAAVLIEILKRDPQFPPRLKADLEEVQALWFYKKNRYDSAAFHLEKALDNAASQAELARWEYLIAQLYERAEKPESARLFYEKAIQHTYDPILDVYARLNAIRQNKASANGEDYIQKNIDALAKLGKKEIYEDYRDIIFYTAAQMELQRNQKQAAIGFLLKSARYSVPNSNQKNKTYLQLGDLAFEARQYKAAKSFYDSVNVFDTQDIGEANLWTDRKMALQKIVQQMAIIERQDSLLRIAAMSPDDRNAYIKKMVRALRKQQGLAEEEQGGSQNFSFNNDKAAPDLFSGSTDAEWYFYNGAVKSKGFNNFRSKWGNRANVDNWQVSSMAAKQGLSANRGLPGQAIAMENGLKPTQPSPVSTEALLANLPLTPETYQRSRDSLENAFFALGKVYQDALPDYAAAIGSYDSVLNGFPDTRYREEALFDEYYCYKKLGDENNAKRVLDLLQLKYPGGKFMNLITNPNSAKYSANAARNDATKRYEKIYNAFIEGDFGQALQDKHIADSLYGESYWTPQLLYIESVYFIHERNDNQAVQILNRLINKYPNTPMAIKAKNILNVLGRRKQIEDYLTNLKIERATDSTNLAENKPAARPSQPSRDSTNAADSAVAKSRVSGVTKQDQIDKPDAGKLGIQKISTDPVQLAKIRVDSEKLAMLQRKSDSIQLALTKSKNDAAKLAFLKKQDDSVQAVMKKLKADSTAASAARISAFKTAFAYAPDQPQYVAILLNRVDPVYVTETRNAFNRYNKENYFSKPLDITNAGLNDTIKLVLIRGFENNQEALNYLDKARKLAGSEIIPWLPAGKYSFLVITEQNLGILQNSKDLDNYRKFLSTYYPGRF